MDYAELARIGRVSRARVSQIMDLLNLAPNIQEELFSAQPPHASERSMRTTRRESAAASSRIVCSGWRLYPSQTSAKR